jgi:hypothetical protein
MPAGNKGFYKTGKKAAKKKAKTGMGKAKAKKTYGKKKKM